MNRRRDKKLEIFIFGVALVAIIISLTAFDKKPDIMIDDFPTNRPRVQAPPYWSSEMIVSAGTTSTIDFNQITDIGGSNGRGH